jgi:hypothetical protein
MFTATVTANSNTIPRNTPNKAPSKRSAGRTPAGAAPPPAGALATGAGTEVRQHLNRFDRPTFKYLTSQQAMMAALRASRAGGPA